MSIRLRFTLALTAVGVVLFGMYALWAYRSEREELRISTAREITLIGRSLEIALGNALRDHQQADVDESLVLLAAIAPDLGIHIQGADGRSIAHSRAAPFDVALAQLVTRAVHTRAELVAFDPPDDPTRLVFAAPLMAEDGTLLGAIAISRSVDDLATDLARTRDRLMLMVAGFLLVTIAAGVVLGTLQVTRPIARLHEGMRQVREGDFRSRV